MRGFKSSVALLLALLLTACSSAKPEPTEPEQAPAEKPEAIIEQEEAAAPETESVIRSAVDIVMRGDTRKSEDDITLFNYAVEIPELTAWRADGTQITEAATPEEEKALQAVQTFHDNFTVWYAEETMNELEKAAQEDLAFRKEMEIE